MTAFPFSIAPSNDFSPISIITEPVASSGRLATMLTVSPADMFSGTVRLRALSNLFI